MTLATKPCPFCGAGLQHVETLAKSFEPLRVYHEWHHPAVTGGCFLKPGILFVATDEPDNQREVVERWNRRP